jgi:short-subunit dehydrogenase
MSALNGVGSRTVLITGAGKGLGRALALELAKKGHTVIGCARTQDRLNSLQSELSDPNSPSDKHLFLSADVVSLSLSTFCYEILFMYISYF